MTLRFAPLFAFLLSACASAPLAAPVSAPEVTASSPHIVAALADPSRPAADRERDANRRPAETMAFAGIRPGDRVGEYIPGGGYFTRLLGAAVGPTGRVFPVVRPLGAQARFERLTEEMAPTVPNATLVRSQFATMTFPEPLDVFFSVQNYHDMDLPNINFGPGEAVNRAVFNALKPGGVYFIVDHTAVAGSDTRVVGESLHRIDPAVVRREMEAIGFVFDGESQVLRNPNDPLTVNVFDDSIRGRTDQFMMRFRKPG